MAFQATLIFMVDHLSPMCSELQRLQIREFAIVVTERFSDQFCGTFFFVILKKSFKKIDVTFFPHAIKSGSRFIEIKKFPILKLCLSNYENWLRV